MSIIKLHSPLHEPVAIWPRIALGWSERGSHRSVKGGGDLCTLFKQPDISAPQYVVQPSNGVAIVCTDTKADDIFALLCIRQVNPVLAAVFTVGRKHKDTSSILEKRVVNFEILAK